MFSYVLILYKKDIMPLLQVLILDVKVNKYYQHLFKTKSRLC